MKHFIGFIFIATIFAIGMPTTECAIPKLSPQVRENAQNFIAEKLEKYCRWYIDSAAFKQDIDTSFALLDTFPAVLISSMAKQVNGCNDASAGLRKKIASFHRLEDRKSVCCDCLRDLFIPNLPKMERKKDKGIESFESRKDAAGYLRTSRKPMRLIRDIRASSKDDQRIRGA